MKNVIKLFTLLLIVFSSCKKDPLNPVKQTITISENIIMNTTWKTGNCYIIDGKISINTNAILTIEEGVTILLEKGAELAVSLGDGNGTLIAKGTEEKPILFTSNSSVKQKGDWNVIWFYGGSSGSILEYCNFEYGGGYNDNYGMLHLRESDISIINCSFSNSEFYGVSADENSKFNAFDNNSFSNCNLNPITVHAIALHTIGNGNSFDSNSTILVEEDWIDVVGDYIWSRQDVPYLFVGSINIGSSGGTTITIEPGTVIEMSNGADLYICKGNSNIGVLKAIGTQAEPIVFTSASPNPAAGDWNGIWFEDGTSAGTVFDYCEISYGGGYAYGGNMNFADDVAANVSIVNSKIYFSEKFGVYKHNSSFVNPVLMNITYDSNQSGNTNF